MERADRCEALRRRAPGVAHPQHGQIGVAEADLQFGTVWRERCGLFQFRSGLVVFVPLGVHRAQILV
jgi:hypothetical protein